MSIISVVCALIVNSVFCALATPVGSGAAERLHLRPKFVIGQILRYQITTRTTTTSNTTTPIVNAEGASQLKQTLLMQLRIDVLAVDPGANGAASTVRLRATYEKASATSESDSYDPDAATLVDQFNKLEGRAVEFTIDADGKLSHVAGLDQLLANPVASNTVRSSMAGLSASALFPKEGIVIGQKWTSERPLENTPLAGLTWRTESTYVRDESVPAQALDDATAEAAPAKRRVLRPQPTRPAPSSSPNFKFFATAPNTVTPPRPTTCTTACARPAPGPAQAKAWTASRWLPALWARP